MPNFVQRVLCQLDIFGSNVGLNYDKSNVYQTSIGGIMSLIFGSFIGIFFWSNIQSFLKKESVNAYVTKLYDANPPPISFDSSTFMFAVKIDQDNFLTKPLFNLTLELRDYVTFQNGTKVKNKINNAVLSISQRNYLLTLTIKKYPAKLEKCTLDHFVNLPSHGLNWTERFNTFSFQNFLCPQISQNFTLGGNYNSEHFYHWKFTVSKCSNKISPTALWKPTCATDKEITDYFAANSNVRFIMYINNFLINPLESENFMSSYVEDQIIFSIQRNVAYTTADIYFTENTVQTDQSLLPFEDIQTESFMSYIGGNLRQQYVIGNTTSVYADFFIRKDSISYTISRSFMKISDILSYIGGFTQVFILITAIIVNYYNEYVYSISLATKIYDFEFSYQRKKKNNDQKEKQELPSQQGLNAKKSSIFEQYKLEKDGIIEEEGEQQKDAADLSAAASSVVAGSSSLNQSIPQNQDKDKNKEDSSPKGNKLKRQSKVVQRDQISIEIPNLKNDLLKEAEVIERKKNNKRTVTTREEDGLMPLDKIKSIIEERKQKLEQKRNSKMNEKGFTSTVNDIQLEENENKNKIRQKQYTNQFYENMKSKMEQVESKDVMNESITPESPVGKNKAQYKNKDNSEQEENSKVNDGEIYKQQAEIKENQQENQDSINFKQSPIVTHDIRRSPELNSMNSNQAMFQHLKSNNEPPFLLRDQQSVGEQQSPTKSCATPLITKGLFDGLGFRDKKSFLTREFEFLLKRQKSIQMTFKFFLHKMSFGKLFRTEQVLLLDKADKQMKKDLDIFTILNRIKELEKFKALFLDRNQEILFNFFPKPIISIQNNEELLSRAEMIEHMREKKEKNKGGVKINMQSMKKMKLNFKTAILVSKAATLFKKPLTKKIDKFDTVSAYQKLYESYEAIKHQNQGGDNKFNQKLIQLLGDEMNKILEISDLIGNKNVKKQQSGRSINNTMVETPLSQLNQFQLSPRLDSFRNNSFLIRSGEQIGSGEILSENRLYLLSKQPSQQQSPTQLSKQ